MASPARVCVPPASPRTRGRLLATRGPRSPYTLYPYRVTSVVKVVPNARVITDQAPSARGRRAESVVSLADSHIPGGESDYSVIGLTHEDLPHHRIHP